MSIRKRVIDQILPVPEKLTFEADEYIFTLAPALGRAMILNEPLCNYGIHSGNLFQFGKFDPHKVRRKLDVLEVLLNELPPKLQEFNVEKTVIDRIFCGTRVGVERMRLELHGGSPVRTFAVERAAYQISYREVTWRHKLFQVLVLALALVLPPRLFYRFRRWYSDKGLSRLRSWTGTPVPIVNMIERRPNK